MAYGMTLGTSVAVQTISDSSISVPLINYPQYAYYVYTFLEDTEIRLYSVQIHYSAPD